MSDLGEPVVSEQSKRLLKLVYIMGGILMLLFIAVIVGLFYKLRKPPTPPIAAPPLELGFTGAEVSHIALDGNRLAISGPHEIVVIDMPSGKVLSRIQLK